MNAQQLTQSPQLAVIAEGARGVLSLYQSTTERCAEWLLSAPQALPQYPLRCGDDHRLILCGINFEPFAADMRYFALAVRLIEQLLQASEAQIIIRSGSPLSMLASPLLRHPRLNLLYVLDGIRLTTVQREESVVAIETLARTGVRVSVLEGAPLGTKPYDEKSLQRRLQALGVEILLTASPQPKKRKRSWQQLDFWLRSKLADKICRSAA